MLPETAIRLARAAFNRALAQADLPAIKAVLAEQATLVTGSDSALIAGRKAQLQAWKREFSAPLAQRTTYIRSPQQITPSHSEPVAMELGEWRGEQNGQRIAAGTYAAKWRNLAPHSPQPHWAIEAEIYVTLE